MKAASNALSLSSRAIDHPSVSRALVDVAEEELRHYRRVLEVLDARGVRLGPPEEDRYAADLRKRAALGRGSPHPDAVLIDRLLVGAMIEARSAERFKLLSTALAPNEPELAAFYRELFEDEAKHHRRFVDLATEVSGDEVGAKKRLSAIAIVEAEVVRALGNEPTMHG
jgi:tRNA-(ms[2]io[6]A)-hydroxylase